MQRFNRQLRLPSPRLILLAALVGPALQACDPSTTSDDARSGRFYGAAVSVGSGTARSYVTLEKGAPAEIGVALSETALDGLPTGNGQDGGGHMNMMEYLLPLPAEATKTPFRLVELDWNPAGHEPPGIYDKPHFDFHFYTITEAERNTIVPTDPAYAQKAGNLPSVEFMAQGYLPPNVLAGAPPEAVAVPRMGMHWLDPNSPELHGQPFTQTLIYGSWDGKRTFIEPMITKAYLEGKPEFSVQLPATQRHAVAGYYPTNYTITFDAQAHEWRIALGRMTKRDS